MIIQRTSNLTDFLLVGTKLITLSGSTNHGVPVLEVDETTWAKLVGGGALTVV